MSTEQSLVWVCVAVVGLGCGSSTSENNGTAGAGGEGGSTAGQGAAGGDSTGIAGGTGTGTSTGTGTDTGAGTGGDGGGTTTGTMPCDAGLTFCDETCVDTGQDAANCGACGAECGDQEACNEGACAPVICTPGMNEECHSPGAESPVGACHGGTHTCNSNGTAFGPCAGEVLPQPEKCGDLVDDDCDGAVNNGCVYTGCSQLPAGAPSGVYLIDPDGAGAGSPFEAFCETAVAGGGWTLVASAADNSYFANTSCYTACGNSPATTCDETPFSSAAPHGDIDTRLVADYKSKAYSTVPFKEMLFVDSNGHFARYVVSAVPINSVVDWYPVGLQNYVAEGVKIHPSYSFPVTETDMDPQFNACGTLQLAWNVEDSDSPVGGGCHSSIKGPSWSSVNNNACYWDDGGIPWTVGAFSGQNATTYRLWLVR